MKYTTQLIKALRSKKTTHEAIVKMLETNSNIHLELAAARAMNNKAVEVLHEAVFELEFKFPVTNAELFTPEIRKNYAELLHAICVLVRKRKYQYPAALYAVLSRRLRDLALDITKPMGSLTTNLSPEFLLENDVKQPWAEALQWDAKKVVCAFLEGKIKAYETLADVNLTPVAALRIWASFFSDFADDQSL